MTQTPEEIEELVKKHLAVIVSQGKVSLEIGKDNLVTIKVNDKFLLSFTGKILVESTKRVKDCERCNSDARKEEEETLRNREIYAQNREANAERMRLDIVARRDNIIIELERAKNVSWFGVNKAVITAIENIKNMEV